MKISEMELGDYFTFNERVYQRVSAGMATVSSGRVDVLDSMTNTVVTIPGALYGTLIDGREASKLIEAYNIKKNIISFDNHFNDNTTYIMGDWCLNGCQLFHKDDAQAVFDKFEVDEKFQDDVKSSFGREWNYFRTSSVSINMMFAKIGSHLEILYSHKHWKVRKFVAEHQNSEINELMLQTETNEEVLAVLEATKNQ